MALMHGRAIEEHRALGQSLPFRPTGGLDQRSQAAVEEIATLADVDNIEDHALVLFHIVHSEVEPETKAGIARIWTQKQIVLELAHQLRLAQVACLECGIKAQVSSLGLAALPGWTYDDTRHVTQSALAVAVLAVCNSEKEEVSTGTISSQGGDVANLRTDRQKRDCMYHLTHAHTCLYAARDRTLCPTLCRFLVFYSSGAINVQRGHF